MCRLSAGTTPYGHVGFSHSHEGSLHKLIESTSIKTQKSFYGQALCAVSTTGGNNQLEDLELKHLYIVRHLYRELHQKNIYSINTRTLDKSSNIILLIGMAVLRRSCRLLS